MEYEIRLDRNATATITGGIQIEAANCRRHPSRMGHLQVPAPPLISAASAPQLRMWPLFTVTHELCAGVLSLSFSLDSIIIDDFKARVKQMRQDG